jgi:hypothetical protein
MAEVGVLLQWTDVIAKAKKGNKKKAFEITVKKMNRNSKYLYIFVSSKWSKGLRIS